MRDGLLAIGEVARMKGVGVKALRYWEEVGALVPAFVDPDTHYRYYSVAQLPLVDAVMLCLDLEIPLREVARHLSSEGGPDAGALFQRGEQIALERLRRAQASLMKAEAYRAYLGSQRGMGGNGTVGADDSEADGTRELGPCSLLAMPWEGPFNLHTYVRGLTSLYQQAKALGLVPLVMQGFARLPDPQSLERTSDSQGPAQALDSQGVEDAWAAEQEGAAAGRMGAEQGGSAAGRMGADQERVTASRRGSRSADGWRLILEATAAPDISLAHEGCDPRGLSLGSVPKVPLPTDCGDDTAQLIRFERATYRARRIEAADTATCFERALSLADEPAAQGQVTLALELWTFDTTKGSAGVELLVAYQSE